MNIDRITWEPCEAADVTAGQRVAPLATWTLDVLIVDADGTWVCRNLDTRRLTVFPHAGFTFKNLHRLCVDGVPVTLPERHDGIGFDPLANER